MRDVFFIQVVVFCILIAIGLAGDEFAADNARWIWIAGVIVVTSIAGYYAVTFCINAKQREFLEYLREVADADETQTGLRIPWLSKIDVRRPLWWSIGGVALLVLFLLFGPRPAGPAVVPLNASEPAKSYAERDMCNTLTSCIWLWAGCDGEYECENTSALLCDHATCKNW